MAWLLIGCMLLAQLLGCQTKEVKTNQCGNTAGNINNGGEAAIQGDWIYFSNWQDDRNLYKIKTDGSGLQKIYDTSESGTHGFYSLNVAGDWVYYTGFYGELIHAVKTDGSEHRFITDNLGNFFVVGDQIYFFSGELLPPAYENDGYYEPNYDYGIYVVNMDETGRRRIAGCDYDASFCIDGDWIYYIESKNIYAIKTDGSEKRQINEDESRDINVVDGWIYYYNADDGGRIYAIKTDGSGRRKVNDDRFSYYINVVGEWIYYCPISSWGVARGNIYAIKTDGSERRQINSDLSFDIKIVGEWIYYRIWNDTYRIKIDGSERQEA